MPGRLAKIGGRGAKSLLSGGFPQEKSEMSVNRNGFGPRSSAGDWSNFVARLALFGGSTGAIGLPVFALIGRHQALEAMAWMGLSVAALTYDVWHILRALRGTRCGARGTPRPPHRNPTTTCFTSWIVAPVSQSATRNYHLQVRR